jgi:hypothetical protein
MVAWCCKSWIRIGQGTILQNLSLPTLQPDCLCRLMLVWRQLVSDFEQPDDETDEISLIKVHVKFAKALLSSAKQELALVEKDVKSGMVKEVVA